jgi:hypothetical protein
MKTVCFAIAAFLCTLPLTATAASLPIEGSYGDKAGCRYAKIAEASCEENFILLTKNEIRSAVSLCEIKSVDKTVGDKIAVTLSCADEGDAGNIPLKADVIRTGKGSYRVDFSDGTSWGPFKKCK